MEERCTLVIELKFGVCFVIRRRRYSGDENWMIRIWKFLKGFIYPVTNFWLSGAGWSLREVSWRRRRSPGFGRVLLESSDQGICGEVGVELSRRRSPLGGKMLR